VVVKEEAVRAAPRVLAAEQAAAAMATAARAAEGRTAKAAKAAGQAAEAAEEVAVVMEVVAMARAEVHLAAEAVMVEVAAALVHPRVPREGTPAEAATAAVETA